LNKQTGAHGKHVLSSEKGAALLIALLAVMMMALLGLVLLEVLRGGLTQAASSEARIQAEALAQKGLDDSLALIRHAVEQGNQAPDYRTRIDAVHTALGEYLASSPGSPGGTTVLGFLKDNKAEASRGSYSIRVVQAENKLVLPLAVPTSPDSPYVYKVVIESTGRSGTQREVSVGKKMTVYISTINPVFRYPVSSSGDMALNGAPAITGDVFVNGGLSVTGRAQFVTSRNHIIGSDYPSLKGFVKVNGGSYTYKMDGVIKAGFENGFFSKHIPFVDASLPAAVDVDVQSIVEAKSSAAPGSAISLRGTRGFGQLIGAAGIEDYPLNTHPANQSLRLDNRWAFLNGKLTLAPGGGDPGGIWINQGGLYLNSSAELLMSKGSLYIANDDPNMVAAHLGGTLGLEPGEFAAIRGNVTLYNGFELKQGVMYIAGDLKIIGNVSLNGTLYVDGNVELKEMTALNSTGALVIAAQGNMVLGNNASDQKIRSFLYSNSDMGLYGVKSKLDIRGGIHGKNVALNAVRGEVGTGLTHTDAVPPAAFQFLSETEQKLLAPSDSRLRIEYDSQLYEDPPSGIPTIDRVQVYVSQIQFDNEG
jgi:hypothetical protein